MNKLTFKSGNIKGWLPVLSLWHHVVTQEHVQAWDVSWHHHADSVPVRSRKFFYLCRRNHQHMTSRAPLSTDPCLQGEHACVEQILVSPRPLTLHFRGFRENFLRRRTSNHGWPSGSSGADLEHASSACSLIRRTNSDLAVIVPWWS